MSYLLVGAIVLGLFLWAGKPGRILKNARWRIASGAAAIGVFAAAAFVGVRGGWGKAAVLGLLGLGLSLSSRWPRTGSIRQPVSDAMSADEARGVLGVGAQATAVEIQAAYARLIRLAHPDRGGTHGLAAQLNRARDRLLKG
jgi:hypothetical protein